MSTPHTNSSPGSSIDEKHRVAPLGMPATDLEAQAQADAAHSDKYLETKAHRTDVVNAKAGVTEDIFVQAEGTKGPDFRGVSWPAAFVLLVKVCMKKKTCSRHTWLPSPFLF